MRFYVRLAGASDANILGRHRAEMFRDMGLLPDSLYAEMERAAANYFAQAIPAGEYIGWLALPDGAPDQIAGGAGLQIRPLLPGLHETPTGVEVTRAAQGLILNVFTERRYRRLGVARLLMEHVLEETRVRGFAQVCLHASAEGRPLYESLGFRPTNEMRLRC